MWDDDDMGACLQLLALVWQTSQADLPVLFRPIWIEVGSVLIEEFNARTYATLYRWSRQSTCKAVNSSVDVVLGILTACCVAFNDTLSMSFLGASGEVSM